VSAATFHNPVITGEPGDDHGDPFVVKYLDSFYLYHSGESHGRRGISVHRSQDLVNWERQGIALEPADSGWAWSDLWAPEVVYERGTFYMYVSGTRRRGPGTPALRWQEGEGDEGGRRLGVARAASPLGPFLPDPEPLLDRWSIDGHPFRDDDGAMWLFYNVHTEDVGPDLLPGTGTVCDRLVTPDRLRGRPLPVTLPSEAWEGVPAGDWYWNEAPFVLKRRGRYYQLYSGGSFMDETYAVGLADALELEGPWHKHPANPVTRSAEPIRGPGHVSVVFGPDAASRYAVYHAYVGADPGRKVLVDRLRWAGDRPVIEGPTADAQPAPAGPALDPDVPHRRAEAWVRGSWLEVGSTRFELSSSDAWHQVEVVLANDRYAVRVGGVLRASRPGAPAGGELFGSDGSVAAVTQSSALEDADIHPIPAGSSYAWHWGGSGPLELSLAARGTIELTFDGEGILLEGDADGFRLIGLARGSGAREIAVRAVGERAAVADLLVCARQRG
jgi:GH43 family beta-xylosidase